MIGLPGLGADTNIKAVITAEDKASHVLKGFGDNVGGLGSAIETGLKTVAIGATVATAAAVTFGTLAVKAFDDSQNRIAQTNAVLKSTGQVAGVTADQVTKLATALEKQTKFSDEDIRSVENLLLTFTSIGKDIFPQATKIVLDMATALGEDTKSASIQLGKALQDPVLGVTALRRVGVNFNSAQQDVIKNLVDTGQAAKAQQLIMAELTKEFGGSAEAAGNTFAGSLSKLKNQINNVEEAVGSVIVKRLTPFVTKALEAVAAVDWDQVITNTVNVLRNFASWLQRTYDRISDVAKQVAEYLGPKLEALWGTLDSKVVPILMRLWREVLEPLVPVIGTVLVAAIGLAIDALNLLLAVITPVINYMLDNKPIVIGLAVAFGILAVSMNFGAIVAGFQAAMGAAMITMDAMRINQLANLNTALTTFGGFGVFAAVAIGALAAVYAKGQETLHLLDTLNAQEEANRQGDVQAMQDVANAYHSGRITKEQYQKFFSGIAGRAVGGPVQAGTPYIVGESGHELFVPDQSGQIIPNNKLGAGSMGGPLNVVVNVGLYAGSEQEKRRIAMELFKSLQDVASSRSTSVGKLMGIAP
jgi:hypothetical protein